MNASYEWLRAFVPIDATPAQLRDLLTAHTVTVEDLVPLRADLDPIVVARVVEAAPHPDSDHLWLTKVDFGGAEPIEVICGAPNVTAGRLYPFAPVGTTMPNGMKIERRKIRGVFSNGMLCSAKELGLGDDHQGILELNTTATPGTPFLSIMPIGDTRLVLDVGANRPDLLSHLGIARELTAISGHRWSLPEVPDLPPAPAAPRQTTHEGRTAGVTIRIEPDSRARRYLGAVVRGVTVGPSPEWMVRRLEAVGVRSISNVVDATNYVLHELGQPIHAFDLAKIGGASIVVRRAHAKETLVTLDGVTRTLSPDTVVIADGAKAQAVAGVMGGRESEVSSETRDLFVEVASFDPRVTRSARKAIGLSTDASYRFERGVDPELAPMALERVLRLIMALAGGTLADTPADVVGALPGPRETKVRASRIAQVLGEPIPMKDAGEMLRRAGFEILSQNEREVGVRVPSWRGDVSAEIDLVEEVARFHGYDRFPDEIRPFRATSTVDDPNWIVSDRVRTTLVGSGLLEIRPMPFVHATDESHVRVGNPLAENEAYLRHSLLETLSRRAEFNLSHRTGDVRLFEIGSVFFPKPGASLPREELHLGILVMGKRRPAHFTEPQPPPMDEWDAKALAETSLAAAFPGQHAELLPGDGDILWRLQVAERSVGRVVRVRLDAPVWAAPAFGVELRLAEVETAPAAARGAHAYMEGAVSHRPVVERYRALPTMPAAEYDLALLVPQGTSVADVERVIRSAAGELLERLDLFDQYTGAGVDAAHRSLAWRLTLRHPERTLRDKEIEGRIGKILGALQQELHVRQRSA